MQDNTKGKILAALTSLIFGFSFIFTKTGTSTVPVLELLGWRFMMAFIFFELIRRLLKIPLNFSRPGKRDLILLGLFFPVLYFSLESLGIRDTTASEAGVILSIGPIVTMLLSSILLREFPRKDQFIGIFLSTLGVIIMVLTKRNQPSFSYFGYLMLISGVFSYSFYSIIQRKLQDFTVYERTYFMLGIGALVFFGSALLVALTKGQAANFLSLPIKNKDFLVSILYLSLLSSNVAFLMNVSAIGLIGPTATSSFSGLTTLTSVLAGVILLNEEFIGYQWLAAGLIILGVFLANKE
ncbi:MAG: DMT family transporter [Tissierellia bacterium]|nr:DMT family transporter [Tissierellia bacterium]